jgi:hypothetical protein
MPHYEINIAKGGQHFFATHERSIGTRSKAKLIYDQLRAAFPEEAGYSIEISYWEEVGKTLDPEKLI